MLQQLEDDAFMCGDEGKKLEFIEKMISAKRAAKPISHKLVVPDDEEGEDDDEDEGEEDEDELIEEEKKELEDEEEFKEPVLVDIKGLEPKLD